MMVGSSEATVSPGSLGLFLRTSRRSRCVGGKVHVCESARHTAGHAEIPSLPLWPHFAIVKALTPCGEIGGVEKPRLCSFR